MVEAMADGFVAHDGKVVLASNASAASLLDCPADSIAPGEALAALCESLSGFDGVGAGAAETDLGVALETGRPFRILVAAENGRFLRLVQRSGAVNVLTLTDVTEDEKRKILLETTLASMAQGVIIHDEHVIVASNDRVWELLDLPPETVAPGRSWEDFVRFRGDRGDYGLAAEEHLEAARRAFREQRDFSSQYCAGDRYLLNECRHENNLQIVTYTDVTEAKLREDELQRSEAQVRQLANHDSLTELTNRRAFDAELERRIRACGEARGGLHNVALMMIDLDRFKPINDTYGHSRGDQLLCDVARRVRGIVREQDTVARIGGDEFAIIVSDARESLVETFANRVRREISRPFTVDGSEMKIDASIGIAFTSGHPVTADDLIMAADLALYAAKDRGRGQVAVFEQGMAIEARNRQDLERDLRLALMRKELVLYYQVQRDLKTTSDVGYEALMRWHHPIRGMIPPDVFIPIAEESGLIVELGRWALTQACSDFAGLDDTTRVSVNVSPVQFINSDLVADVREALDISGLDPERLEIEITEQLLLEDTEHTAQVLTALRAVGISVSLDDFGSGYSSLAYLTRFPIDKIKIDRCFVQQMLEDQQSSNLVFSILALADSLNIRVTAEGVESEGQMQKLMSTNCDEAQGFLLGRPQPLAEIRSRSRPPVRRRKAG